MESAFIINSIGIGGVFFVGLIVFWFVFVYLKRRMTSDQSNPGISNTANISWEEKRRHPRIEISWQARIESGGKTQDVLLKDISLGGAFVICQEPLNLQDRLALVINLPDNDRLQLNAEVVWSNFNMPSERVVNRGMGIKFIKNEADARQKIHDAIDATIENSIESDQVVQ